MISRSIASGFLMLGILLAAALARGDGPASDAAQLPPSARARFEETTLASVGGFDSVRNIAMSIDGNHVCFIGVEGKKQLVVFDGNRGPSFDWIIPNSLNFSPGAVHVGYLTQTPTQTIPVIDGISGRGFYLVEQNRMYWSSDSKRVAFIVEDEAGARSMVVDALVGPKYDAIQPPYFSPDAKHFAYVAQRGKQQFIVSDGKEQKPYDAAGRLTYSADSNHLAAIASLNGKWVVLLDGQEGRPYDSIKLGPGFSTDSKRLVGVVAKAGKLVVVINGRESPPYEAIVAGDFVLSPDGKRTAYAIKDGDKQIAVIDGVPQHPFARIGAEGLAFSPDSKHIAYVAGEEKNGPDFVVRDGVPEHGYEGILIGTPIYSPDSQHLAYGAKAAGKWRMVVDQVEGKPYDAIERPVEQIFSPDSKRLTYCAIQDHKRCLIVDGSPTPAADFFGPPSFSPDSRHLAVLQFTGEQCWMVVDSEKLCGPYTPATAEMRAVFDDNTHAHFVAWRKDDLLRVNLRFGP